MCMFLPTPGDGMGLRQKGLSFLSLVVVESSRMSPLVSGKAVWWWWWWWWWPWAFALFLNFFLLGEFFRLDLKLLLRGTLTIQEGGTISWKIKKKRRKKSKQSFSRKNFCLYVFLPLHESLNHMMCHCRRQRHMRFCYDKSICTTNN